MRASSIAMLRSNDKRGRETPAVEQGGAPPRAPDADGRVDVETAQRIVRDAVVRAVQREEKAVALVRARADEARRKVARHNLLLGLGVAAALVAVAVAGVVAFRSRRAADALAREVGLGLAPAARPSGAIPEQVLSGRAIFEQNRQALYVMGYTVDNRIGGCCSAFAIAPDLLATNAHCIRDCRARGGTSIATLNDSMGKTRFRIVAMSSHPAYKSGAEGIITPDVALLRIDGKAPRTVKLANDAELRAIGPGDDAYVLGFPGRLMDPLSPSATFLEGRIGRVTGIDGEAAAPDRAVLIQHDAVTRGGNSGSPIFNQYGHVIGIHAAHIDDEDDVTIDGRKATVTQSSPFRLGMRIDLLQGVPAP
ncbi:S1 family peptidase [Sorangium sp. So ce131]|uniref:S1 family peptidase n=1 Tax=Sorangium sp. So ce131 TaxID=3133282 RepID=UPI003F5E1890